MRVRVLPLLAAAISLAAPAVASADVPHTVGRGESLWSIAAADGLTVDQLAAANGVSSGSDLIAGRTLVIPPQEGGVPAPSPAAASEPAESEGSASGGSGGYTGASESSGGYTGAASSAPAVGGGNYVVQPGDTLWGIAERSGMSVAQLAAENAIDPNGILRSGAVLSVGSGGGGGSSEAAQSGGGESSAAAASASEGSGSSAGTETAGGSGEGASAQPVGGAAEGSSGGPPYTTAESVAPSTVGQIASANAVSPSLAEAIAYQESGFDNALTSSADARGVMQILPGTWNWINQNLAGSTPLDPASAGSNIRAGVLLLHSLLNSTGGDPALAAAGYYQGLPSVLAHGEYSSTQRYVNDVMALRQRFGGG